VSAISSWATHRQVLVNGAASHSMAGPKSLPVVRPELANPVVGPYAARYRLFKDDGRPFEGYAWEMFTDGQASAKGLSNAQGKGPQMDAPLPQSTQVRKSRRRPSERIEPGWSGALNKKAGD